MSVLVAMSIVAGSAASASTTSSDAALKHAALNYAKATLNGTFVDLEAALSPECRSTDHVTAQNLPFGRVIWEDQMGISFKKVRITGVRVEDLTGTSAQAEVEYNTSKAGNNNWVTYVLDHGHWLVGGQCAMPVGGYESSTFSGGGQSGTGVNNFQNQAEQYAVSALSQAMEQQGIANTAAASAASAAEDQAVRNKVPLTALTTAYLNAHLSAVTWVGASTATPYTPRGKRIVGIGVHDGHIVTAVQPYQGGCNFGLVVTSPSDPIIVTDHLGGPGIFGSNVGSATPHCGVASAPSSWLPVKPQPLSSFAHLQRPTGGCSTTKSGVRACPIQGQVTNP